LSNTSAMPLMPIPPMPMKCRCWGDAAHADSADADEVQVLGLKKHF